MAAASSDFFVEVGAPGSATTLSAPGHSIAGTTFNVVSTSNWPTTTGAIFAVDTFTTQIIGGVSTAVRTPGSYTEWEGVVASSTQITGAVLRYGTDQNYSAGASTRVYIPVASSRENRLSQGILVDHSQSGGHEIATNFDPSNPTLETQKWVGVASAVNEITLTNAATGTGPIASATGGDTNIDYRMVSKGTGTIKANGNPVITELGLNRNAGATITTAYADYATVTATSGTGQVEAEVGFIIANANSGADRTYDFRVLCDGAAITPAAITGNWAPYISGSSPKYSHSFNFSSTPGAGSHTWKFQILASANGSVTLSDNFIRILEVA